MVAGIIMLLIGCCLHGTVSYGRILYTVLFTAFSYLGILFEEQELFKAVPEEYLKYTECIPSRVIPDPRALLYSEERIYDMRAKITKVK